MLNAEWSGEHRDAGDYSEILQEKSEMLQRLCLIWNE